MHDYPGALTKQILGLLTNVISYTVNYSTTPQCPANILPDFKHSKLKVFSIMARSCFMSVKFDANDLAQLPRSLELLCFSGVDLSGTPLNLPNLRQLFLTRIVGLDMTTVKQCTSIEHITVYDSASYCLESVLSTFKDRPHALCLYGSDGDYRRNPKNFRHNQWMTNHTASLPSLMNVHIVGNHLHPNALPQTPHLVQWRNMSDSKLEALLGKLCELDYLPKLRALPTIIWKENNLFEHDAKCKRLEPFGELVRKARKGLLARNLIIRVPTSSNSGGFKRSCCNNNGSNEIHVDDPLTYESTHSYPTQSGW